MTLALFQQKRVDEYMDSIKIESGVQRISMGNLQGAFYFFLVGLTLAILTAAMETWKRFHCHIFEDTPF